MKRYTVTVEGVARGPLVAGFDYKTGAQTAFYLACDLVGIKITTESPRFGLLPIPKLTARQSFNMLGDNGVSVTLKRNF
jgi:hypothetical protein